MSAAIYSRNKHNWKPTLEKIFLKLRLGEKVNRVKLISFRPECQGFGEAAVESVNQLIETAPEESTTKLREGHQTWDEEKVY